MIVGGYLPTAGGVARWNGSTWSAMGWWGAQTIIRLALVPGSSDVIALTSNSSGPNSLMRFDGTSWSPFGALSPSAWVTGLDTLANGDLVIAGSFLNVGGTPVNNLARFDGTTWHALGNGDNPPSLATAHAAPSGELFVGGDFATIGPLVARSIARFAGGSWRSLGAGVGASVVAQTVLPDGRQVVATTSGRVLRRDGASWTSLSGGLPESVRALAVLANGDLIAGGMSGSVRLVRWNGSSWVPFAAPLSGLVVSALHALPDGLLVGGTLDNSEVRAFAQLPDGSIAVGGSFYTAGGLYTHNVVRWDGTSWSAYGLGLPSPSSLGVHALTVAGNGELIAGGSFGSWPNTSNLARWNGSAWVSIVLGGQQPYVNALLTLPGGDVVAGGDFTSVGGTNAVGLGRWNGTTWSAVGGGVGLTMAGSLAPGVSSLLFLADGRLSVGGSFGLVGGAPSAYLAWLTSGCPASVAAYGAGCTGSGGTLQLWSLESAWVGGTMRSACSGLLATSLVARVLGFGASSLPLASLLPTGGVGCNLLVDPVVIDLVPPLHGTTVTLSLPIPANPALVGATLREQAVEFEFDAAGGLFRINSSNALFATLGRF
ncbi:MAG: Rax2 family protein [Planctomycetes bacterium]|nr:Rax2 family protein [Planctomycetota bacterium]